MADIIFSVQQPESPFQEKGGIALNLSPGCELQELRCP